jgi:hypothetical protein
MMHVRGRGLRSNTDLILCLPGETLQSHVTSIQKLLNSGVSQVTNFQLMMLKGSELETLESRRQFAFETRYRVLPKNFGIYGSEKVFDVEEIAVATDTMSFDDYLQARKFALISVAFCHNNYFDEALDFADRLGVKRFDWVERTLRAVEEGEGEIREFMDNFVRQTRNELFTTKEECVAYYSEEENFKKLLAGEIGENLMHKHNAMATFYLWPHICSVGMTVARDLLIERGVREKIADFDGFWRDFHAFVEHSHAWGRSIEQILSSARAVMSYDIAGWLRAGTPADIEPYRLSAPREFDFRLTPESERALRGTLEVWTTRIQGLTKAVTRIQPTWQNRECSTVEMPLTASAAAD